MPRGLYIHIPFCVRKCLYCDFVSFADAAGMADEYLIALEREAKIYRGEEADTVFIGGGTPTVLSAKQLERLMKIIRDSFKISADAEITAEANPGTVSADKARAMLGAGINRVSVGVQSFNDTELKALGRIHDADEARKNIEMLHDAGFNEINIDLMTSVPYQSRESLLYSAETALSLPVTHISAYSLILEQDTPLFDMYENGVYKEVSDEEDRESFAAFAEKLDSRGFERYEISNFALPGHECRHNLKYWNDEEYIGLGVAAHSYVDGVRSFNTSDLKKYIAGEFKEGGEKLDTKDMMSEFMLLGLRLTRGISTDAFKTRFGRDIYDVYGSEINRYLQLGLMESENGRIYLNSRGLDVSNSIMCDFML